MERSWKRQIGPTSSVDLAVLLGVNVVPVIFLIKFYSMGCVKVLGVHGNKMQVSLHLLSRSD